MKQAAFVSLEGAFPNSIEQYLQEAMQTIKQRQASVLVGMMATDYFTISDKKDGLNYIFDTLRSQGIATILILNSAFTVQDLSGIRADRVEFVNFHLWRNYNEIINKKVSGINPEWNADAAQFLFLTGKPDRQHRVRLLWKFEQAELLDQCCWSFWYNPNNLGPIRQLIPEVPESQLIDKLDSWLRNPDNIKMNHVGSSFHYCGVPYEVSLFANSRFRVISESVYENAVPSGLANYWLGEKTYVTLFNRVPWIIAGQPGSLAWLRSEGYLTFDNHLLEPYDMILNGEQRLDAIVNNTKFWMKEIPDPDLVRQKIEHNFHRAVAQAQKYETVLKDLIEEFDIQAIPEQLVPTVDK